MSRSTNILVVIIAIFCVFVIGIMNVLGIMDDLSEPPAEWKDYFILNGTQYFNTYNIIDDNFADKQLGKIMFSVPKSADASSYKVRDGEAVYLSVGTKIYSVKGYASDKYAAAYDNGDYYLYCVSDSSPKEVIEKCGVKSVREEVDFKAFYVNTVCRENTDYGVRISVIRKSSELNAYLSRYVNDFAQRDSAFTYDTFLEKRTYDDPYFKKKLLIAVRLPEDDGKIVFDLDSITTDELKMTLHLRRYHLPDTVTYDSCRVRHLFVEIGAEDYEKQKITYQLERCEILPNAMLNKPDATDLPLDDDLNPMQATVKFIRTRREALGTEYESFVYGYSKEFFDENFLVVVSCTDELCDSDYAFASLDRVGGRYRMNITRSERADSANRRISFFTLELALEKYRDMLIIPSEITAGGSAEHTRKVQDVLVIDSVRSLEDMADKYGISQTMYDEEFFEEHVLLFVGDLVCSDEIELKYVSVTDEDGQVRMEIDELIPAQCKFCPSYKYAAIPYLRSELEGDVLAVNINPVFDAGEDDQADSAYSGSYFGMPFR